MHVLILAAGYGTRLDRDLLSPSGIGYQHLIGTPKPLLPLGNKPLLSYWMEIIMMHKQLRDVHVATNAANQSLFREWAINWPFVKLYCDGSHTNEERSGAICCMKLAADYFNITDDILLIAGDTVFKKDFNLQPLLKYFNELQSVHGSADLLVYVTCKDEDVNKHGIIETDEHGRVIAFLEKPLPNETASRKECPCFYFLTKESMKLLDTFLLSKQDAPLTERDAPGNFIRFLITRRPVYAIEVIGRFDVGNLQSYIECNDYFESERI